jgi:hypothetical protein
VPEAMGGYFELELQSGHRPFADAHGFNLARSAFQALLQARRVRRVFVPYFICSVMPDAARTIDVEVVGYELDEALELPDLPRLAPEEMLLYVDYFGLKADYIRSTLSGHYPNALIVDNSQALFSPALPGVPTLYSPRKFVGVPDGGWLVNAPANLEQPEPGTSVGHFVALLGRLGNAPEAHYADFVRTEEILSEQGLKGMSWATTRLLDSIDYRSVRRRREANFSQLHAALSAINAFKPAHAPGTAALCYPLMSEDAASASALRAALLEQRIFVPSYWREVLNDPRAPALERDLSARLLPLPIDQRYGPQQIDRLASIIHTQSRTA